jgi:hypothetical protein
MTEEQKASFKRRGEMFMSLPISDWHQIIKFETIVKNYMKMCEMLNKNK